MSSNILNTTFYIIKNNDKYYIVKNINDIDNLKLLNIKNNIFKNVTFNNITENLDKIKNKIKKINNKTSTNKNPINGLIWTGNSCYADSVLVALFAVPNFFTNKLLNTQLTKLNIPECGQNANKDLKTRNEIQKELKRITNSIRGEGNYVENITPLRELFKNCPHNQKFNETNTQDAGEFLIYILKMFPFLNTAQDESITFGTNSTNSTNIQHTLNNMKRSNNFTETSHTFNCDQNVIMTVISEVLNKATENQNIDTFLNIYEDVEMSDWRFKHKIKIKRKMYTPYLIFNLMRRYMDSNSSQKINNISINPIEEIILGEQKFNLSAIVIHNTGHYTCVFKYNDLWYHYDDNNASYDKHRTKQIGNYQKMLEHNSLPKTHGTLYFYAPSNDIDPPKCPPSTNKKTGGVLNSFENAANKRINELKN